MYFDFDPFRRTLEVRKMTQYRLIHSYYISPGQLDRMRKNQHVSTHTIEQFCKILCCGINDIIEQRDDDGSLLSASRLDIPLPCVSAIQIAEVQAAAAALPLPGEAALEAPLPPLPHHTAYMPAYPAPFQVTSRYHITYKPFWKTLKAKGVSQYVLTRTLGVSHGQLDRMRKNEYTSTTTLLHLCMLLDCSLCDIIELQNKYGTAFPPSVLPVPENAADPVRSAEAVPENTPCKA